MDKSIHQFQIIHHRGEPNRAQLPDGTWVERRQSLYIPEMGGMMMCAPYSEHFIFEIPARLSKLYPGPIYRCTCGSAAIFAGPNGYLLDNSPVGKMMLCQVHATTGKHATGGERWV